MGYFVERNICTFMPFSVCVCFLFLWTLLFIFAEEGESFPSAKLESVKDTKESGSLGEIFFHSFLIIL